MRFSKIPENLNESDGSTPYLILPERILTEHALVTAYAEICRSPVDQVYIVPCPKNIRILNGVIFVRKGLFGGGVFRFDVQIPEEFPNTVLLPTVLFEREIFHPFISMKTRQLDLTRSFPDGWKHDRHTIRRVIVVIQRTFYSFEISSGMCLNPEAALLLKEHRSKFREISTETVEASRTLVYDNVGRQDGSSSIKFSPWNHLKYEATRNKLATLVKGDETKQPTSGCRREQILVARGLRSSDVIGKSYPASYSWFDPIEMTLITTYDRNQKAKTVPIISARTNRERHGIEPLDLKNITTLDLE